MKIRSITIDNQ